jgi:hypothetical protein
VRQGKGKVITTTLGDLIAAALIVLAATIIQVRQREVLSSPVGWPPAPPRLSLDFSSILAISAQTNFGRSFAYVLKRQVALSSPSRSVWRS